MDGRLTVTRAGLFVLLLLLVLGVLPVAAQEGSKPSTEDRAAVSQEITATPVPAASPQVEPTRRPQTVGEALGLTGKTEKVEEKADSGESELNFPDRDKRSSRRWVEQGQVGESTFFDKLVEVTWSLALISFLIWGSAKLAAKMGLKQLGPGAEPKSMIEILERKRLSPGRSILLMRVGPKVLAVAATESGYETLTEFEQEEFKQYQDQLSPGKSEEPEETAPQGATTPADIARHYLSIIPGTGAKK